MMNCVIFAVLLSAIGGCYVWLGVKKNERAARIRATQIDIANLNRQIVAATQHLDKKLDRGALEERVAKAGLDLKSIPIGPVGGRLVRLPEPVIQSEAPSAGDRNLATILRP